MKKQGFDSQKYIQLQSQRIRERIAQFGGKLYLEFGGKLFDDHHASRVLPGFAAGQQDPYAAGAEGSGGDRDRRSTPAILKTSKLRGDLGITYETDVAPPYRRHSASAGCMWAAIVHHAVSPVSRPPMLFTERTGQAGA